MKFSLYFILIESIISISDSQNLLDILCKGYADCEKPQANPYKMTSRDLQGYDCFCDSDCFRYHECCPDVKFPDLNIPNESFFCQSSGSDMFSPIYIKQNCPAAFINTQVKMMCEHPSDDFSNIFISNPRTKTTYGNIFCAICNKERAHDLVFWNLIVKCPNITSQDQELNIKNIIYQPSEPKGWQYMSPTMTFPCTKGYQIPPSTMKEKLRLCKLAVSTCAANYTHQGTIDRCQMYTNYRYACRTMYKNPDCARCNFITDIEIGIGCIDLGLSLNSRWDEFPFEAYQWQNGQTKEDCDQKGKCQRNFLIHLDADFRRGGRRNDNGRRCPAEEVYNVYTRSCRKVTLG